jgi:Tol biopolymer transport system component
MGDGDIWIFDQQRGTALRFTFDRTIENAPVWSPDATWIAFASNRNGTFDLYQKRSSGAGQDEVLLQSDHSKTPEDWSADGRFLLYRDQGAETGADLWLLPLAGDRRPQAILNSPFEEREGRFSADGRWIAYVSNESGPLQLYVQAFPVSGVKWQISTDGGHQPRWPADGKELFFLSEAREVMSVPVTTTSDGAFQAGIPQKLFPTTAASVAERNSWDAAPDGQRFLVNSVPVQRAPITVVVNWQKQGANAR